MKAQTLWSLGFGRLLHQWHSFLSASFFSSVSELGLVTQVHQVDADNLQLGRPPSGAHASPRTLHARVATASALQQRYKILASLDTIRELLGQV